MENRHDQYLNRLNGLLRMRNVDVCVTGGNSKLLSHDVMTEFRAAGTRFEYGCCPSPSSCRAPAATATKGWAEYAVRGGQPLASRGPVSKGHHDIETPPCPPT